MAENLRARSDAADDPRFVRRVRALGLTWLALIVLMLLSLGSAWLKLGVFNMVAGLAIAAVKTALVVWLFMCLRDAGPLIRLTAVAGVGALAILFGLSGVDYATRTITPSQLQRPQQLLPVRAASAPH
jgi:cytochrome c oxidase subunit 4